MLPLLAFFRSASTSVSRSAASFSPAIARRLLLRFGASRFCIQLCHLFRFGPLSLFCSRAVGQGALLLRAEEPPRCSYDPGQERQQNETCCDHLRTVPLHELAEPVAWAWRVSTDWFSV
jgi:hypothetical protein